MVINIDSSEQSRARLQLQPTPRYAGPASPDVWGGLRLARPRGRGLRLVRPLGSCSASSDPEAAGSASPDLWGRAPPRLPPRPWAPPRPTPRVQAPSRLTPRSRASPRLILGFALRLARPLGCGPRLTRWGPILSSTTLGLSIWVWVKTLTPGKRLACLDVTCGHDGPYLRIHIKNSVGRAGTVLPNPRTNVDRRSPRRPPGRNGTP